MADGPVTIADVAAAAGVSVATVSKVINDRYGVAEQTSARVREVIEQLGYTSSLVAQSLRSRRSNVIGVIASDIEPFNAELLKGAARGLRGTGYDLIVFSDCGRYEDQAGWEQRSLARVSALTDGSVLVTPSSVDVTSSRPLVAVDHNVRSTTLPTVDSDNLSGGVTATEYLIGLGHRRIGFLAGRRDLESSRLRQQGYRRALETAGIPFDEDLVRVGGYRAESAHTAARELLDRDDRPTAIFAANDTSGIETIAAARELGLVGARGSVRGRVRQRPGVGALRAAAHHRRPVRRAHGLRGRADGAVPHRRSRAGRPAGDPSDPPRRAWVVPPADGARVTVGRSESR